jgi:hypothetical protein
MSAQADLQSIPGRVWQKFPQLARQDKIKRDLQAQILKSERVLS